MNMAALALIYSSFSLLCLVLAVKACCNVCLMSGVLLYRILLRNSNVLLASLLIFSVKVKTEVMCEVYSKVYIGCCVFQLLVVWSVAVLSWGIWSGGSEYLAFVRPEWHSSEASMSCWRSLQLISVIHGRNKRFSLAKSRAEWLDVDSGRSLERREMAQERCLTGYQKRKRQSQEMHGQVGSYTSERQWSVKNCSCDPITLIWSSVFCQGLCQRFWRSHVVWHHLV